MPRPPAEAERQQPRSKLSHVNVEHGHAIRGWPEHVQRQRQASASRTNHVARLGRGSAETRPSSANARAQGAELSDSKQCQCSSLMPLRRANALRNEHGRERDATGANIAMHPATGPGGELCRFVVRLLLLLLPNRAPGIGGVLHERKGCAARRANRRPLLRSTHRGQTCGMRLYAPLLLLAAWLGVCSAMDNTICSVEPTVCSGTYSSSSLDLDMTNAGTQFNGVLRGTLPTQLGALTALRFLNLARNMLSGSLPTQLAALTSLLNLHLLANQLSGSLPTQLGVLTALNFLNLLENKLSGSLPTQLGALTALQDVNLARNCEDGSLPTQLGALTALQTMDLNMNNLSGSLPSQLGGLTALVYLDFHMNNLSGSLPTQLGALTSVVYLQLDDNHLSGSLPTTLGWLKDFEYYGDVSCSLGGTNSFSCPTPVEISSFCTGGLQCASDSVPSPS